MTPQAPQSPSSWTPPPPAPPKRPWYREKLKPVHYFLAAVPIVLAIWMVQYNAATDHPTSPSAPAHTQTTAPPPKPLTAAEIAANKKREALARKEAAKAEAKRRHDAAVAAAEEREQEAEAKREQEEKGFGLTYDEVTHDLTDAFDLKEGTPVDGRLNYSGPSVVPGAVLQVVGDHDNVYEASMVVVSPQETDDNAGEVNVANAARLLMFMKNVAPDWDGATDWLTSAMKRAEDHPGQKIVRIHGSKRYMVQFQDIINSTVVQVDRSDYVDRDDD